ncbi:ROK family transcriptional regulator [Exiguobacterium oxidotolerans]|uniref:Sugar kinase n=1 Tax=Exiguobacterium oxidotolerans TaxID=223958 RepID=A0A653IHS6_9BACL|nr:ROK family protein [Exiguobacterium oxidotolerans]VWX38710.1 Sugar kinase [Exiguobacterium oxidotolerans]
MAGINTELVKKLRQAILFQGIRTIPELSRLLSASFPTVKKHLEILIAHGEVEEQISELSNGGRPAKQYQYRAEHAQGLALYLELDAVGFRIFDAVGTSLTSGTEPVGTNQPHVPALIRLITRQLEQNPRIRFLSVGVAASVENGQVFFAPDYPSLQQVDLKGTLESQFGLPVVVENDMNAAVIGFHEGHQRRQQSLIYLYLGKNGPGAGILINGQLVRGSSHFAGEISVVPQYDKKTFGQAIAKRQTALDTQSIDAISRLTTTFAATLNPHLLIFNGNEVAADDLEQIRIKTAEYITEAHIPLLIRSNWEADYLNGLTRIGLHLSTEQPVRGESK